jgi:hypothetical protein
MMASPTCMAAALASCARRAWFLTRTAWAATQRRSIFLWEGAPRAPPSLAACGAGAGVLGDAKGKWGTSSLVPITGRNRDQPQRRDPNEIGFVEPIVLPRPVGLLISHARGRRFETRRAHGIALYHCNSMATK